MAQHFLLSKEARSQPLVEVARMSEAEAYRMFCQARWPKTNGRPDACPHCGVVGNPWRLKTRKRAYAVWKCRDKNCRKEFTVTSGTIFANHKLPFRDIVALISETANSVKSKSALQLSRELGVCYKTAWTNLMKLRQAMAFKQRSMFSLSGVVEMDGMYLNRHNRPTNRRRNRVDGRLAQNRHPGNRCIIALRQRISLSGPGRTISLVTYGENDEEVLMAALRFVEPGTVIITDEHDAYTDLGHFFTHEAVRHATIYAHPQVEGEVPRNTNQVESFFVRIRRSQKGIHHRMNAAYLDWYVAALAWQEDHRYYPNGAQTEALLKLAMEHKVSRWLNGYWQGNHVQQDELHFTEVWPPVE